MIAAISLMRRQEQVDLARFRRHWLDIHGPLVCAFAGLHRYVQCHVIESPVMNDLARGMRIDGFPILYFANDEDRAKAHGSPEMAACNVDSRLFIGAVSRVITDVEQVVPPAEERGRISLLLLFPEGTETDSIDGTIARAARLPRLRGLIRYRVREQGRAPASTVGHLAVAVAAVAQARFDSIVDLEGALADWDDPGVAQFVVEEHWLA
jgi:uncharacterized protein (TIGR02118 family)